ncbi:MAG: hypothetical protein KKH94_09490 [Candidatus Omnitrophica bacterium]|nr:hypothetical protein [Candidatus Omnitrophota bacterium]
MKLMQPIKLMKLVIISIPLILVITFYFYSGEVVWGKRPLEDTITTDEQFLDLVQYKTVQFFFNESNKVTGLVKDRANNFKDDTYTIASIASVGYALPAYVIGAERGWISKREAYGRVLNTLLFFKNNMEHKNGFYYHFVDMTTGKRARGSELSSIDTALFLAGVLFVRQYYKDTEIERIATELYEQVDWQWMLDNGKTFNMGWRPTRGEGRFLEARWRDYNECMILYILGIGAPKHSVPSSAWDAITRKVGRYGNHILIQSSPLFTHQYSHAFIDFRNKHDNYADYFVNSVDATLANREFCIDNKGTYKTYSENVWGLTACDGPRGYKAYGAKPGNAQHDGTVAPTAAGGSIVFTPELSIKALRYMFDTYRNQLWGRYGFSDSFNVSREKGWFAQDVIGIDQGTILIMIENYRSGLIWNYFMQNKEVQTAMDAVGFVEGTKSVTMPTEIELTAPFRKKQISINGDLSDWSGLQPYIYTTSQCLEYGDIESGQDFAADLYFSWDREYLYVAAKVTDNDVYFRKGGDAIYKNDCLELYFDPHGDGLLWGNPRDVQLGLSPHLLKTKRYNGGKSWAWFQNKDPEKDKTVILASSSTEDGYILEAAIKWSFINFKPAYNKKLRLSPAFHDYDLNDKSSTKMNLFFQDINGKDEKKKLAILTLL